MVMTVKELKEKLELMPDCADIIAVMGKERADGDVVNARYDEGVVVLDVII